MLICQCLTEYTQSKDGRRWLIKLSNSMHKVKQLKDEVEETGVFKID